MMSKLISKNFYISLLVSVFIFTLDRISKIYVINLSKNSSEVEYFSSKFLNITLIWNEGIAFGLLSVGKNNLYNLTHHLKAYEDCIQRLGKNLGTVVNQYNEASSEFKKIDKDVVKISSGEMEIGFEPQLIDKPRKFNENEI